MSNLDNIVNVSISRETQAIAQASFGIFGIIAEFTAGKTLTPFERYRNYASITELIDDGWSISDAVCQAAEKIFSQNPSIEKILVGRKDAGDDDWTEALTAIQTEIPDWYMFLIYREVIKA